jgi:predicted N-formylglutamate amidohydrolase
MNSPIDVPPVSSFNENGQAGVLLVCEHASHYIPPRFENLQLSDDVLHSHAALDIGALDLARIVSQLLNAPLLATGVSRLVYDCNRAPGAPGAIPEKSEVFEIPGNQNLAESETRRRCESYYLPFETAVSQCLAKYGEPPLFISIHSFTPIYHGVFREVDIGLVCDQDSRLGESMVELAPELTTHCVRLNEPYGPGEGVTHTLGFHAVSKGLPNAMIEVKNDLLGTVEGCKQMASILATLISRSAEQLGYTIPVKNDDNTDYQPSLKR